MLYGIRPADGCRLEHVGEGYAGNAVNVAVFRKSPLASFRSEDGRLYSFCAYYDGDGAVIAARKIDEGPWELKDTGFGGGIQDAHNAVSLVVDGEGFVHMAWSRHNGNLSYVRSGEPCGLSFTACPMTGRDERRVTYPEFHLQPSGDLFFIYRDGTSGNGNVILNRYMTAEQKWYRVQDCLISGLGECSPYWQACTDSRGRLHISWTWRGSGDVYTNYNICYAVSEDCTGEQFTGSDGVRIQLPCTEYNSELVKRIPQGSMLINQTSMTTDDADVPYIVSWWQEDDAVQYYILRLSGSSWECFDPMIRSTGFDLSGTGTKRLPCARPQILVKGKGESTELWLVLRDSDFGSRAMLAYICCEDGRLALKWLKPLTVSSLGEWEPAYDIYLWKQEHRLSLFVQAAHYAADAGQMRNEVVTEETGILAAGIL